MGNIILLALTIQLIILSFKMHTVYNDFLYNLLVSNAFNYKHGKYFFIFRDVPNEPDSSNAPPKFPPPAQPPVVLPQGHIESSEVIYNPIYRLPNLSRDGSIDNQSDNTLSNCRANNYYSVPGKGFIVKRKEILTIT